MEYMIRPSSIDFSPLTYGVYEVIGENKATEIFTGTYEECVEKRRILTEHENRFIGD